MYQALYRSFRPETVDAILGQEHIVRILKNQIDTGTTSHAYLFCGTRGTGKTSTARLLAKGMNCLAPEGGRPCGVCENCMSIKNGTFMDVMEIDAASNNGVENIRELRESVKYPPVAGRCKVYIIDEVHMLSTGAFNALLKTLEEPPENVMFILATTEVHKLPATILSRCLRLDFKRVPERQLKEGMRRICSELGITVEESALGLICANADGSVRDGLSLLDQCISGGGKTVSRDEVLELIGASGEEVLMELTDYVSGGQVARALIRLNQILADGKDVRQLMKDWIEHYRSLLMTKYIKNPEEVLNLSTENVERIRNQSERLSLPVINNSILELSKTLADAKWSTQPRVLLELAIVRLGSGDGAQPITQRMVVQPQVVVTAAPAGTAAPAVAAPEQSPVQNPVDDVPPWEWPEDMVPLSEPPEEAVAAAAPVAPVTPEPQVEALDLELEDLWYSIFDDPAAKKGSFLLLRMGSKLHKVTENEFFVEASNAVTKGLLKDNEGLLSQLMEQKTGRKMRLVLDDGSAQAKEESKEKKAQDLARSMEEKLGFPVEVR
ncbi:MAG: DNA polymerase III subunit gamma/tau [Firmicutes bacterium]|nr:DNA polymerase III subunit gamma/tau [Bacillota bacterium]